MAGRSVAAATAVLVASVCLGLAPSAALARDQAQPKGPAFDCSKASGEVDKLTQSWIASDVRGCVEAQYQLRTAELQVLLRLVPSQKPVFFACNNNAVAGITAEFFQTDPPAARFERGDRTATAYLVRTASGAKYEGQNFSFWNKGKEATVTWLGEQLTCKTE